MWRNLSITVARLYTVDLMSIEVLEDGDDLTRRRTLLLCDSASLPSVLCELLHELTGSSIPASDGV